MLICNNNHENPENRVEPNDNHESHESNAIQCTNNEHYQNH